MWSHTRCPVLLQWTIGLNGPGYRLPHNLIYLSNVTQNTIFQTIPDNLYNFWTLVADIACEWPLNSEHIACVYYFQIYKYSNKYLLNILSKSSSIGLNISYISTVWKNIYTIWKLFYLSEGFRCKPDVIRLNSDVGNSNRHNLICTYN